jgi:hypothetical protein
MRRAIFAALALALAGWGAACAAVLGVDKEYVLAQGEAGADGGATSTGVRCAPGEPPCVPTAQECCFGSDGGGGMFCAAAVGSNDPCANGTDIYCATPSDCANSVCYLCLDAMNDILGTSCVKGSCAGQETALCAPQGGTCPGTQQCKALDVKPVTTFQGWFYGCQ